MRKVDARARVVTAADRRAHAGRQRTAAVARVAGTTVVRHAASRVNVSKVVKDAVLVRLILGELATPLGVLPTSLRVLTAGDDRARELRLTGEKARPTYSQ